MEDEERLQGRAWEGDCGRWVHEEPEGEGGEGCLSPATMAIVEKSDPP